MREIKSTRFDVNNFQPQINLNEIMTAMRAGGNKACKINYYWFKLTLARNGS